MGQVALIMAKITNKQVDKEMSKTTEFFTDICINKLSWWISVLFMIGASLFALACVLFLQDFSNVFLNGIVFFVGSIFFTSAAYCQYFQVINSSLTINNKNKKIIWFTFHSTNKGYWTAFTQWVGTLFFNVNTFDGLLNLGWFEQDLLIWVPNIIGSLLFQCAGTLAMFDISSKWWKSIKNLNWWVAFINFLGCVAFIFSACLAFFVPEPLITLAKIATSFTLVGAICFFASAYLSLPVNKQLK